MRIAEQRRRMKGYLGIPNTDGTITFADPDRTGYTLCRVMQGSALAESSCINLNVPEKPNVEVWFDLTPQGTLYAVGFVKESAVTAAGAMAPIFGEVGKHTHARGSGLEYVIETRLLDQGFVSTDGNAGMVVAVKPFLYEYENTLTWYAGGTLDLTANIPSTASKQRMVLVVFRMNTAALVAISGSDQSNSVQLDQGDVADIPITAYDIPLMGAVLSTGMSAITNDNIFFEGRVYFPPRADATPLQRAVVNNDEVVTNNDEIVWN